MPLASEGRPFQLFTLELVIDDEVRGHVRDFYPGFDDDKDLLADVLNLVGLRYAPAGDDGESIRGGESANTKNSSAEERFRAAVRLAKEEEQRAVRFGFDRLELEYRAEQIRGLSENAKRVLRALVKKERPEPVRKGLPER